MRWRRIIHPHCRWRFLFVVEQVGLWPSGNYRKHAHGFRFWGIGNSTFLNMMTGNPEMVIFVGIFIPPLLHPFLSLAFVSDVRRASRENTIITTLLINQTSPGTENAQLSYSLHPRHLLLLPSLSVARPTLCVNRPIVISYT